MQRGNGTPCVVRIGNTIVANTALPAASINPLVVDPASDAPAKETPAKGPTTAFAFDIGNSITDANKS